MHTLESYLAIKRKALQVDSVLDGTRELCWVKKAHLRETEHVISFIWKSSRDREYSRGCNSEEEHMVAMQRWNCSVPWLRWWLHKATHGTQLHRILYAGTRKWSLKDQQDLCIVPNFISWSGMCIMVLHRILQSGEDEWRMHGTSLYIFCNFLWLYSYFKMEFFKSKSTIKF